MDFGLGFRAWGLGAGSYGLGFGGWGSGLYGYVFGFCFCILFQGYATDLKPSTNPEA